MQCTSPASSSFSDDTTTTSADSFATLFRVILASVVCSFLDIADVLAVSSVNHAARRMFLSSPAVWRTKVFRSFPVPPSSPVPSSAWVPWLSSVVYAVSRVTRQLVSFALLFDSHRPIAASYFPSTAASLRLPSWCDVVQVVHAKGFSYEWCRMLFSFGH